MPPATGAFEAYVDNLVGLSAGVDLSTKQYHFMKYDSDGNVIPCSALGEAAIGVLQDKPPAGRACSVAFQGQVMCKAGAAIARGALVGTNASGRAVTVTKGATDTSDTGAASDALRGGYVVGRADTAAAADGDLFTLTILNAGVAATTAI